jgi:hypothetical protein
VAAGLEFGQHLPLRGRGRAAVWIVHTGEQLDQPGIGVRAFDGQRALPGRGNHLVRLEDLGDQVKAPDPLQPGAGQHHGVEFAGGDLREPGAGVAADRDRPDVGSHQPQLRGPAGRPRADERTGGQVRQLCAVPCHERVPGVATGRHRRERDAGHGGGGEVLEGMDGEVDVPGEQAVAQRAHEDAGAPDLRQLGLADIAERGQSDQLDRHPGALPDQAGDGLGLGHGHRALARAQAQHRPAHAGPPGVRSASAVVTKSIASWSRSKSTRRAAS